MASNPSQVALNLDIIATSYGALLLGGLVASLLSGIVVVQVVVYFKLYTQDVSLIKLLVLIVWLLDTSHTICLWLSLWDYFIDNYGNPPHINDIVWGLAASVLITALLTSFVHMFYARRIFLLSKRNLLLTMPIAGLAILRLVCAAVTTGYMLKLGTLSLFKRDLRWLLTTGLALSSIVDILITLTLFILLQANRTGNAKSNAIIDSLTTYAFETGALTCAGTVVSMICWLVMSNNLIFLGLHFVIGKLYANSLLITLNTRDITREWIRRARGGSADNGAAAAVHVIDTRPSRHHRTGDSDKFVLSSVRSESKNHTLEVSVEQSVQFD